MNQKEGTKVIRDYFNNVLKECKIYKKQNRLYEASDEAHNVYMISENQLKEVNDLLNFLFEDNLFFSDLMEDITKLNSDHEFYQKINKEASKILPKLEKLLGYPREQFFGNLVLEDLL